MRDSSDRNDYINSVLEQIDDITVRREIRKELSTHIDDREEYFKDCGYAEEEAEKMAVERMGPPKDAADGFNEVHIQSRRVTSILAVILLGLSVLFFYIYNLFTVLISDSHSLSTGFGESISLIFIITVSVIGKWRNSPFICLTSLISFIMTHGIDAFYSLTLDSYSNCSPIIFKLISWLTLDFDALNTFWRVEHITVAPYLTYLSAGFYFAVFVILISVFISVCMLKRPTYSLNIKQFTRKTFNVQNALWLFVAASVFIFPIFGPTGKNNGMTVKTPKNVNYLIIAQSDRQVPLSEIPSEDILIIDLDCIWGVRAHGIGDDSPAGKSLKNIAVNRETDSNGFISENTSVTRECGNKFKYITGKTEIPLAFTKDCTYIEFIDSNGGDLTYEPLSDENAYKYVSDKAENWYKTDSTDKITAAVDPNTYNQVEITFSKAE